MRRTRTQKGMLTVMLIASAMAAVLTGCDGPQKSADSQKAAGISEGASEAVKQGGKQKNEGKVLRVGLLPLSVGVPAQYAKDKGWFSEEGLNVDLEYFATGSPLNEAIAADKLDIACSGFASIYSLANAGCLWIADVSSSSGGMGIYARKDSPLVTSGKNLPDYPNIYGNAAALKGLEILEPLGTSVQFMTESYAAKFGLEPSDIKQVNMEYASAFQAFQTGEGDLVSTSPPYSYQMDKLGYVNVCNFDDATGIETFDGCFVRGDVAKKRPEDVTKFLKCLVHAMDDLQDETVRFDYTKKFYTENGQDFNDDDLKHEMKDRIYVGSSYLSQKDYRLGEAWPVVAKSLVFSGKITADNVPNVAASIHPSYLSKATGIMIQAGGGAGQ